MKKGSIRNFNSAVSELRNERMMSMSSVLNKGLSFRGKNKRVREVKVLNGLLRVTCERKRTS